MPVTIVTRLLCTTLLALATLVARAGTTVVCVGDSITKGVGADPGQDYPSQLARALGAGYEVRGYGVNGATAGRHTRRPFRARPECQAALAADPAVVVIMLGTNDTKPACFKDRATLVADIEALAESFLALPGRPRVLLCKPPMIFAEGDINERTLAAEVLPAVEQAASALGIPVIDCHGPFVGRGDLVPDGVHPNTAGAGLIATTVAAAITAAPPATPANAGFPGTEREWQGFRRHEFECDGRPCVVTVPAAAAAGRPWLWRARFPEKPAGDRELLEKGFHVAYIDTVGMFANARSLAHWDAFHALLTRRHGLSTKPALLGISRGGLNIHKWAAANPDKVSCIVGVAPVCDIRSWPGGKGLSGGHGGSWRQLLDAYGMTEEQALAYRENPVDLLEPLARAGIPVLHVYSPQDEAVPYEENTRIVAERLTALGGEFKGLPFRFERSDDPSLAALQAVIDAKNPLAVARAHSNVCGAAWQAEVVAFILAATGPR